MRAGVLVGGAVCLLQIIPLPRQKEKKTPAGVDAPAGVVQSESEAIRSPAA